MLQMHQNTDNATAAQKYRQAVLRLQTILQLRINADKHCYSCTKIQTVLQLHKNTDIQCYSCTKIQI